MGTMGSCGWSPATAAGGGSSNSDEVALAARIGSSFPVRAWKTSTSMGHGGDGWTRGSRGGAGRIVGILGVWAGGCTRDRRRSTGWLGWAEGGFEGDLECGGGDGTDYLKSRVLARLGEVGL